MDVRFSCMQLIALDTSWLESGGGHFEGARVGC